MRTNERERLAAAVTGDPRWAAVQARDAEHDGRFCYSVATTGVFCRPSCGARRPRPEHVEFHADAAAARRRGFRACRRCAPERDAAAADAELLGAMCRALEQGDGDDRWLAQATRAGRSRRAAERLFRQGTGLGLRAYAAAARAGRLRTELAAGRSVTEAMHRAGYSSTSRLHAAAGPELGMTPDQFRRGGAQQRIQFAVGRCSLGRVLAAATARGVCAILLGDDDAALQADLARRFPRAGLEPGDAPFASVLAAVIALVDGHRSALSLPLDLRGTLFQRRVWRALAGIVRGSTATYGEIAAAIGAPRAVRAVAGACAGNPLAIAIPCHRVLRSDGSLSGYRWGVERKRELLRREGALPDDA